MKVAPKIPTLPYKLAINLVISTGGFLLGTFAGATKAAKAFFSSDAPLAEEYRKLYYISCYDSLIKASIFV